MAIDWNDPTTLAEQYLAFLKSHYTVATGFYLWEVVNGIPFDWHVVKREGTEGKKQTVSALFTKSVYLACRYLTLASVISADAGFGATKSSQVNCEVWMRATMTFSYLIFELASILIAIRVITIWNRHRVMTALCVAGLALQLGYYIREIVREEAKWDPTNVTCLVLSAQTNRPTVTVTLAVDMFLLISMLVGLWRWRDASCGRGLWSLLWQQGLIWLAVATLAEIPTVVLLWLNLNQAMDVIFFTPEMIIVVVAATRMYRILWSYDPAAYITLGLERNLPT
ncbi:unnamed protein product [Peniophora sp. CBMAI 1063]|nr:unnamed protein product [Peniophora sp. CBMAI 1063]